MKAIVTKCKQMADGKGVALRVSQLDAAELDGEILALTKTQLSRLFKYQQTNVLANFEPEINAGLKLLIWKFSVQATESTLGQKLLNLKYFNKYTTNLSANQWISHRQKLLYACLLIGCPWLKDRSHDILKVLGVQKWRDKVFIHLFAKSSAADLVNGLIRWLELAFKISTLVNFLAFLQKGEYLSVLERLVGIRSVFPEKQGSRQVTFEFMTRELLWHGFSEFLFFVLPLINFQRIKNLVIQRLLPTHIQPSHTLNSPRDYTSCAICGEWPIRAQEIGCSHVFCFYCIHSHMKADQNFACPLCNLAVDNVSNISPMKIVTETGDNR